MKTIILNWKNGENDPFSVFNKTLFCYFTLAGKDVEIIEITDPDWPTKLLSHYGHGIDFVLTWQGLESRLMLSNGKRFWDHYQIPLICIHGDHPCHMPDNHAVESTYVTHIYLDRYFSIYSNKHFRVSNGATSIHTPLLHNEATLKSKISGDFFVIVKNIESPIKIIQNWLGNIDPPICNILIEISKLVDESISKPGYLDIHTLIDDHLKSKDLIDQFVDNIKNVYHYIHSQIDLYTRNIKAVKLTNLLFDFPIKIYGRGWIDIKKSRHHQHFDGLQMSNSQQLFYSKFGIIDISASVGLHDRTLRALRNDGSFLSSADLSDDMPASKRFNSLFYDFNETIVEKCQGIMKDSDAHNDLCKKFSFEYQSRFSHEDFIWKLNILGNSMRKCQSTD